MLISLARAAEFEDSNAPTEGQRRWRLAQTLMAFFCGLPSSLARISAARQARMPPGKGSLRVVATAVLLMAAAAGAAWPQAPWRPEPAWRQLFRRPAEPPAPADNAMTAAKVALGARLFNDPRLSGAGQRSCASCHRPELAFTDGLRRARALT